MTRNLVVVEESYDKNIQNGMQWIGVTRVITIESRYTSVAIIRVLP